MKTYENHQDFQDLYQIPLIHLIPLSMSQVSALSPSSSQFLTRPYRTQLQLATWTLTMRAFCNCLAIATAFEILLALRTSAPISPKDGMWQPKDFCGAQMSPLQFGMRKCCSIKKLGDWAQLVLLAQVENTPVDTWDWLASSKTFCALSYWNVPDEHVEHAEGAALRKLLCPVSVYDAASKILIGDNCGGFMEPVTFRCRKTHCDMKPLLHGPVGQISAIISQ